MLVPSSIASSQSLSSPSQTSSALGLIALSSSSQSSPQPSKSVVLASKPSPSASIGASCRQAPVAGSQLSFVQGSASVQSVAAILMQAPSRQSGRAQRSSSGQSSAVRHSGSKP